VTRRRQAVGPTRTERGQQVLKVSMTRSPFVIDSSCVVTLRTPLTLTFIPSPFRTTKLTLHHCASLPS
jgi:hypothetical protein